MKIYDYTFPGAEWTPDCGGKQDFDFPVLQVYTRYWDDHTARPYIYLGSTVIKQLPENEYISGDTEMQCKLLTEQWVRSALEPFIKRIVE